VGLANDTVKQNRSMAIDMRFYWVRDRVKDGQFIIYWKKGSENAADYFTKHHPPADHRRIRSRYLHFDILDQNDQTKQTILVSVRGCVVESNMNNPRNQISLALSAR
jgi:hypothetical protein